MSNELTLALKYYRIEKLLYTRFNRVQLTHEGWSASEHQALIRALVTVDYYKAQINGQSFPMISEAFTSYEKRFWNNVYDDETIEFEFNPKAWFNPMHHIYFN